MLENMIRIKISGKNIKRFIDKLYRNKIDIINIVELNKKEIIVKISYKDYEKLEKIKSIYNYEVMDLYGKIKIKQIININKYLFIFIVLGFIIIYFLSNIIFDVEISTDNKEMKNLLIMEMKSNSIYKYTIKKDYKEIKKIVEKIKNNNKDKIEWLDISNKGTKYIVNFLERKKNKKEVIKSPRNVIAKKSGIIKKIISSSGIIMESVNNYVNKGDVIISGEIKNNEILKDKIIAEGKVYAEVWYKVKVTFPLVEIKSIKTDEFSSKFNLKLLNNYLLNSKYDNYLREDKIIYDNPLLPISLVKNKDQRIIKKDNLYIIEEAIDEAYKLSTRKIIDMLSENEYIILKKKLNYFLKDSTIVLEVFYKVYEDITDYGNIIEIEEE